MAVSEDDVRHIAGLARLGLDRDRIEQLVRELNGILDHMAVLSGIETSALAPGDTAAGMPPLRDDGGAPLPLALPRDAFAPQMRDQFFLVPRLETHEDSNPDESP